ncbi:hypothetical protein HY500_00035 [Candidatus Woesearchaeota archaeon]|nr:hypothetical protein [Candidatus Woesearchaeota archaeon]
MIYDIMLPDKIELFLARMFGRISEEERAIDDSLRGLEHILKNGASPEELRISKTKTLPEVYAAYAICKHNMRKPYFHREIHRLIREFDERIRALDLKDY